MQWTVRTIRIGQFPYHSMCNLRFSIKFCVLSVLTIAWLSAFAVIMLFLRLNLFTCLIIFLSLMCCVYLFIFSLVVNEAEWFRGQIACIHYALSLCLWPWRDSSQSFTAFPLPFNCLMFSNSWGCGFQK